MSYEKKERNESIRQQYREGRTQYELADSFGISQVSVSRLLRADQNYVRKPRGER